jgi:adenylate cyclase
VAVAAAALVVVLASVGYTLYRDSRAQVTVTTSAVARSVTQNLGNSAAVVEAPAHSIAVLPFLDMSEKHDQEYFGDGMAEEILNLLASIPELKVIGRTSSDQYGSRDGVRRRRQRAPIW